MYVYGNGSEYVSDSSWMNRIESNRIESLKPSRIQVKSQVKRSDRSQQKLNNQKRDQILLIYIACAQGEQTPVPSKRTRARDFCSICFGSSTTLFRPRTIHEDLPILISYIFHSFLSVSHPCTFSPWAFLLFQDGPGVANWPPVAPTPAPPDASMRLKTLHPLDITPTTSTYATDGNRVEMSSYIRYYPRPDFIWSPAVFTLLTVELMRSERGSNGHGNIRQNKLCFTLDTDTT